MKIMLPVKAGISNLIRPVIWKKNKNDFLLILHNVLLDRMALSMVKAAVRKQGAIAQLGERLNGIQEVSGSIPLSSTKI